MLTKKIKACLTEAQIEAKLKDKGVQPTLQRIALCKYVLCDADHPTAEDVHAWAEKNLAKISLATVYNTLNTLVEVGLVREFRFGHSDKVIYDCNTDDHYHFYDQETKELFDLSPESIKVDVKLKNKFEVSGIDILLKGKINN
jgi:Fur family iron response transcriptional regulator